MGTRARSASVSTQFRVSPKLPQVFPITLWEHGKNVFYFPLLNSILKTIKKINLLILITFIQILIVFLKFPRNPRNRGKTPVFLSCYRNTGFLSFRPINARVFKRLFYKKYITFLLRITQILHTPKIIFGVSCTSI